MLSVFIVTGVIIMAALAVLAGRLVAVQQAYDAKLKAKDDEIAALQAQLAQGADIPADAETALEALEQDAGVQPAPQG